MLGTASRCGWTISWERYRLEEFHTAKPNKLLAKNTANSAQDRSESSDPLVQLSAVVIMLHLAFIKAAAVPHNRLDPSNSIAQAVSTPLVPLTASTTAATSTTSAASICSAGDTASTYGGQAILDSISAIIWLDKMFETMSNHEDIQVNSF